MNSRAEYFKDLLVDCVEAVDEIGITEDQQGVVIAALAIPSLLSAWVEGRVPRVGSATVLLGAVLIAVAPTRHPGGYAFGELPDVFLRVIGRLLG